MKEYLKRGRCECNRRGFLKVFLIISYFDSTSSSFIHAPHQTLAGTNTQSTMRSRIQITIVPNMIHDLRCMRTTKKPPANAPLLHSIFTQSSLFLPLCIHTKNLTAINKPEHQAPLQAPKPIPRAPKNHRFGRSLDSINSSKETKPLVPEAYAKLIRTLILSEKSMSKLI